MMVITIARKPLEGTMARNTLKWGTGGINIDATRISHGSDVNLGHVQRQQHSQGAITGAFGAASLIGSTIPTYKPGGRWPANLILGHLPDCVCIGSREVPGYAINQWTDGSKPFGGGAGHPYQQTKAPTPEQVPVWQCREGCPVSAIDEQSGQSRSVVRQGGVGEPLDPSREGWRFTRAEGGFTDTGGASRFFKTVANPPIQNKSDDIQ